MNKQRRKSKSRRIGIKDVYVAAVTIKGEGVREVGVPIKLTDEISVTVKDNLRSRYDRQI